MRKFLSQRLMRRGIGTTAHTATSLYLLLLIFLTIVFPSASLAQAVPDPSEPKLLSIYPLGGRRGTTVRAEVRGNMLQGSYAVWVDTPGVNGRLLKVEESKQPFQEANIFGKKAEKPPAVYQALVELQIPPTAALGVHMLRLVGPRGISDTVPFRVVSEPVIAEDATSHQTVKQALAVDIPEVINGKIEKLGQLDYYSFSAKQGQELSFEIVAAENCDPRMALFGADGSWFDPDRPTRLLFEEERSADLMQQQARQTFRVPRDADYYLEVSALFGKGTPDSFYQVRIASADQASAEAPPMRPAAHEWGERSFTRVLDGNWMESLEAREAPPGPPATAAAKSGSAAPDSSLGSASGERAKHPPDLPVYHPLVKEREPKEGAEQAEAMSVPAVFEGDIKRPGDMDSFKFKVEAGQKLAFEIETPDAKPPYFNPRLGVVDGQDHELFSNVERVLSMFNNNADPQVYLKRLGPKATFTFERAGDYVLQVRDITERYGSPSYRYRVLVRPEIPHVGEVSIKEGDRINLVRGQSKKLTLIASYEEGFTGEVSFVFTGLPEGVQALPGAQFDDRPAPLEKTVNPDVVAPKQQQATVVLLAGPEARRTSRPALVRVRCQPMVEGKPGPSLLVREMPLMVIDAPPPEQKAKPQ